MVLRGNCSPFSIEQFGLQPFKQRFPWLGGDLQTLRDTLVSDELPFESGKEIEIAVPSLPGTGSGAGSLLALLDVPNDFGSLRGLVILIHGLGGSSRRLGLRRMAFCLLDAGFAVMRLNLRGADPGRHLAGGTYAAKCNTDLAPVFIQARKLCEHLGESNHPSNSPLPLFGVGISLGGTILLNACLDETSPPQADKPVLDGLVCTSSPLDLGECSSSIERPRNRIYQHWLLNRLVRQTLEDPFGVTDMEKIRLTSDFELNTIPKTIREFDASITAPRWAYKNVDDYYLRASPLFSFCEKSGLLPPTLILQALDDPWVPAEGARKLAKRLSSDQTSNVNIVFTEKGGHNGFHGSKGCWGDQLVTNWLKLQVDKCF